MRLFHLPKTHLWYFKNNYLVLNMHLYTMQKLIKMNFILSSQQTLGSGYYFLHFTERRVWLCLAEMVRGRAGMGAWKGRLRGSALTHFNAVDIMNDYQVQSHHINWLFYAALLHPLKWWTDPICPTTYIMWLNRLVAVTSQGTGWCTNSWSSLCWNVVSEWNHLRGWTVLQCRPLLRVQGFP